MSVKHLTAKVCAFVFVRANSARKVFPCFFVHPSKIFHCINRLSIFQVWEWGRLYALPLFSFSSMSAFISSRCFQSFRTAHWASASAVPVPIHFLSNPNKYHFNRTIVTPFWSRLYALTVSTNQLPGSLSSSSASISA